MVAQAKCGSGWLALLAVGLFVPASLAGPPRVVSSSPAAGTEDVAPTLQLITIIFDVDMDTRSFTIVPAPGGELPEMESDEPMAFRDARTFVLKVRLAPETAYAFSLNSTRRQGFRAADGTPLAPTVIRFRTRTAAAAPAELTVSPTGEGVRTIGAAMQKIAPGGRIVVLPGVYTEAVVLDRKVTITGQGPREKIVVEAVNGPCLTMQTAQAAVKGLTLRSRAGQEGKRAFGVDILQGQLLLEDCDITSDSLSAVIVRDASTSPTLRRCKLHDSKECGLVALGGAGGTVEDCEITGNGLAGIEIMRGANPTVVKCSIHDGKSSGVHVHTAGQGKLEECDIFANGNAGVTIRTEGKPQITRCRIHDGKQGGVLVLEKGGGTLADCEIRGNTFAGLEVREGGNPEVLRCTISENKESGIYVYRQGKGTFDTCEVFGNSNSGVAIGTGASPLLRNCKIHSGKVCGGHVFDRGEGTFEACEFHGNTHGGLLTETGGKPVVRNCRLHDGKQGGIFVYNKGEGTIEDCDIYANAMAGVEIKGEGNPTVRRCKIRDGKREGALVHQQGKGTFEECELFNNALGQLVVLDDCKPTVRNCKILNATPLPPSGPPLAIAPASSPFADDPEDRRASNPGRANRPVKANPGRTDRTSLLPRNPGAFPLQLVKGVLAEAPRVANTVPAADAASVDPALSEIVIGFDRPMKTDSWTLLPVGDYRFPDFVGDEPVTFRDTQTCVIKVKLGPGAEYALRLNNPTRQGFKAADGTPLESFVLRFKTGVAKPPPVEDAPRVIKTEPPNHAKLEEAGTVDLVFVFSEPMRRVEARPFVVPKSGRLAWIGKPVWRDARTMVARVFLYPNQNYRFGINLGETKPFVSAGDGTPAEPLDLWISTIKEDTTGNDAAVERAVEAIKRLGGYVEVDERLPHQPVVSVDFSTASRVTDADLVHLKPLVRLRTLNLSGTQVTDAGLAHLKDLTWLQSLRMGQLKISDAGLANLKGLTEMQVLFLDDTPLTGAGMEHLRKMTQLSFLYVDGTKVNDEGLRNLKGLTKLINLGLNGTPITNAGLAELKDLGQLEYLTLMGTEISDEGLKHLKGFARLKKLDLSFTKITNAGLAALKPLAALQDLSLVETAITDAGLPHLEALTALKRVDATLTKVTEDGVKKLKQVLKNTDVIR